MSKVWQFLNLDPFSRSRPLTSGHSAERNWQSSEGEDTNLSGTFIKTVTVSAQPHQESFRRSQGLPYHVDILHERQGWQTLGSATALRRIKREVRESNNHTFFMRTPTSSHDLIEVLTSTRCSFLQSSLRSPTCGQDYSQVIDITWRIQTISLRQDTGVKFMSTVNNMLDPISDVLNIIVDTLFALLYLFDVARSNRDGTGPTRHTPHNGTLRCRPRRDHCRRTRS